MNGSTGGGTVLLEVADVTKSFGGVTAVESVTFEIRSGESVGLVGPNGAGKTTLFNCICGQLQPQRGRVALGGQELLDIPTYKRARLGIGPQRQVILSSKTRAVHNRASEGLPHET